MVVCQVSPCGCNEYRCEQSNHGEPSEHFGVCSERTGDTIRASCVLQSENMNDGNQEICEHQVIVNLLVEEIQPKKGNLF